MNNGDGTFSAEVVYVAVKSYQYLRDVAIVDINGDDNSDVMTINRETGQVFIFLNKGNGALSDPASIEIGGYLTSIAVGDLNGDGKPDLAVAGEVGFVTFNNDGTGSFTQGHVGHGIGGEGADTRIGIADLNGDGRNDLVIASNGGLTGLAVALNLGDGTFMPGILHEQDSMFGAFALGRLNGDDYPDIVVSRDDLYIMFNQCD
jgi:hypothetical protein